MNDDANSSMSPAACNHEKKKKKCGTLIRNHLNTTFPIVVYRRLIFGAYQLMMIKVISFIVIDRIQFNTRKIGTYILLQDICVLLWRGGGLLHYLFDMSIEK